eukprot:348152_1
MGNRQPNVKLTKYCTTTPKPANNSNSHNHISPKANKSNKANKALTLLFNTTNSNLETNQNEIIEACGGIRTLLHTFLSIDNYPIDSIQQQTLHELLHTSGDYDPSISPVINKTADILYHLIQQSTSSWSLLSKYKVFDATDSEHKIATIIFDYAFGNSQTKICHTKHSININKAKVLTSEKLSQLVPETLQYKVIQYGYITKQGKIRKNWKRRFALLLCAKIKKYQENEYFQFKLLYFEDDTLSKLKGVVSFTNKTKIGLVAPKSS